MQERFEKEHESTEQRQQGSGNDRTVSSESLSLPPDYHFSAEQTWLLSTVSVDRKDNSGFPVSPQDDKSAQGGFFTTFGLEYQGVRYPYTDKYRDFANRAVLASLAEGANTRDEFIARLENKNENWEGPLRAMYEKKVRPALTRELQTIINEKRSEANKFRHGKDLWNKYKAGPISISARSDVSAAAKKIYYEASPEGKTIEAAEAAARKAINESGKRFNDKLFKKFRDNYPGFVEAERTAKDKSHKFCGVALRYLTEYSDSIGIYEAQKYEHNDDSNSNHIHELIIEKIGNKETNSSPKEMEERFDSQIYSGFDIDDETVNNKDNQLRRAILEATEKAARYYDSLIPEFSTYSDKPIEYYVKNHERAQRELDKLKEVKDSIPSFVSKRVASEISKFKSRIAKAIFPDIEVKDVYLLPTGIVAKDSEGNLRTEVISPLSERILSLLDNDSEREMWREEWKNHMHDYDAAVCASLKKSCQKEALNIADSLDEDLDELSKRFQIEYPEIFDAKTGRIYQSLQPYDYEVLKTILPATGGFIDGISLAPSEDVTLKSTRLEIISFLSGEREVKESLLFDEGRKLKLRALESILMNAGPEKLNKAMARLVPELGISVFHNLNTASRSEFSRLVAHRTDVPRTVFYSVYRQSVLDPGRRRSLVERTIFLDEFQKYLGGKSTIPEFFDKIKKKESLPDNSAETS